MTSRSTRMGIPHRNDPVGSPSGRGRAGVLVTTAARMRTTMLRRALRENPAPAVAALTGLLAAGWLIRYAHSGVPGTLALLTGSWVFGWIVLPLLLGGVRGRLRPAHLRLEPAGPVALTAGLLVASAIGIGPAVSLVALAALPVHAAQHGVAAALLAAVGAALLWLIGLVGSAVALEAVGRAGGPGGAILTGVFTGTVMGVFGSVWAVAPWVSMLLVAGPPTAVTEVLRWVPSGWVLDAATAGPLRAAGLLLALATLAGAAAAAYGWLVRRVIAGRAPGARRRAPTQRSVTVPAGPVRAVLMRELRTWVRHPLRLQYLAFALVYAVLLAALPMLAGVHLLVPWAGPLAVLWAAALSAALVGLDGTALWLPLSVPAGEQAEVRGRALAWLLLLAPIGVGFTLAGLLIAPGVDPLPVLAVLPALLGAGAAVPVWVSLLRVRAVDDPRHPTAADNPTDMVSVLLTAAVLLAAAAPAFALAVWGAPGVRWLALLAGVAGGAAGWWGGTRLADDRLARRGTEVLAAAGRRTRPAETPIPLTWDPQWYRENKATAWALVLLMAGWVPVVPQGLMVLVFDISGGWIVASHLDGAARTGVAVGMVALGGAMLLTGLVLWGRRPPGQGARR